MILRRLRCLFTGHEWYSLRQDHADGSSDEILIACRRCLRSPRAVRS